MTQSLKLSLLSLVILLALVLGLALRVQHFKDSLLPVDSEHRFVVPPNSSISILVDKLSEEGIIDEPFWLRLALYTEAEGRRLQAGSYPIRPGLSHRELIQLLAQAGPFKPNFFRLNPSSNLFEIAEALAKRRIADKESFLRAAFKPSLCAELGIAADNFEGYLAPGHYSFLPSLTAEEILGQMHQQWREQWGKIVEERRTVYEAYQGAGWNDHELLTLASLVEKEALIDRERPIIARVFLNRLRDKQRLESDPTCIYPPLQVGEKPSPKRCRDPQNLYSTYRIPALPPGPITTPSVASLKAVLEPYRGPHANELKFFVAKQDGSWTHYFSISYKEHQDAIAFFLKKQKDKKPTGTPQP